MQSSFSYGMSEQQFRTGTVASLIREINRRGGANVFLPAVGPATAIAASLGAGNLDPENATHSTLIANLIAEANNRFNVRRQAVVDTTTDNEERMVLLEDILATQTRNINTLGASYDITVNLLRSL